MYDMYVYPSHGHPHGGTGFRLAWPAANPWHQRDFGKGTAQKVRMRYVSTCVFSRAIFNLRVRMGLGDSL